MVSFWPWRSNDSSSASFEKALSGLAAKISATQAQLDRTRSTSRRVRVLWTLYLSFAYLVYAIVLVLVVGWQNLGQWEWTGMAGGPVAIYATRTILAAFFNFRADSLTARLKDQQNERAKTIQKLKDATRYDSTQELLDKYGGSDAKMTRKKKEGGDDKAPDGPGGKGKGQGQGGAHGTPIRTGIGPPPTANIPRGDGRSPVSGAGTPRPAAPGTPQNWSPQDAQRLGLRMEPSAEFAPNAFGPGGRPPIPNAQYAHGTDRHLESHWYDRVMDLLLGEDETAAKNRIVLICANCRLVNGQAPPGTKSLGEIGKWKCMGCHSLNGEEDEGKRIVSEVLGASGRSDHVVSDDATDGDSGDSSDIVEVQKDDETSGDVKVEEAGREVKSEEIGGVRQRKGKSGKR